jgi:hypothetical protein
VPPVRIANPFLFVLDRVPVFRVHMLAALGRPGEQVADEGISQNANPRRGHFVPCRTFRVRW